MKVTPASGSFDPRKLQEAAANARAESVDSSVSKQPGNVRNVTAVRADSASLAQDAVAKQHELTVGLAALDALPSVRADRIAEIEQRLSSGYYDRPDVIDSIAGKLVSDPVIQSATSDFIGATVPAPTQAANSEMVASRLASGYYEQSQVSQIVTDRLVQDVTGRKV